MSRLPFNSPIRYPSSSIQSRSMGVAASFGAIASGSSSDTTNYVVVASHLFTRSAGIATATIAIRLTLKHSAALSFADISIRVYAGPTNTGTVVVNDTLVPFLVTANSWQMTCVELPIDLDFSHVPAGRNLVELRLRPDPSFPGTLSWGEPSSTDRWGYWIMSHVAFPVAVP